MELVAQQFMRAVRGKRSQVAFARRLGYRANPITDWERGCSYPTAHEALRAAALARLDVTGAFQRFAPNVEVRVSGRDAALGSWLSELCASSSVRELAERSALSRFAIGRWLSGARKPRLPDFFRLVDAATARLPDLLAELVPIEQLPVLAERYAAEQAARSVAFDVPWSEAILRVLETPAYQALARHRPGVIAARLGISKADEREALARLEAARVVERRGARYAERRPLSVDTRGGKRRLYAIKHHWADVAARRSLDPLQGDVFAYNVMSVSTPDLERIRELLHAAYREIRSIVAASEPAECVALLNLQLVGWNGQRPVQSDT